MKKVKSFNKKLLSEKTIQDLRQMLKKAGITAKREWKKDDIINALIKAGQKAVKGKLKVAEKKKKPAKRVVAKKVVGKKKPAKKIVAKKPVKKATREKIRAVKKVKGLPEKGITSIQEKAPPTPPEPCISEPSRTGFIPQPEGELPREYGENRMALLPRDPRWLFTYWEVRDDTLKDFNKRLPGANLDLRVYDITGTDIVRPNRFFDIGIYERIGNWYINVDQPNMEYIAEIGLLASDGRFLPIIRSNRVLTPRDELAPATEEELWMTKELYKVTYGLGSEEFKAISEKHFISSFKG
ncbi:MAG: DUF4912 domain-containing protein [Nitrospirae bacterium]|nr:DUF4912 domain-containing protein [Nitrospirota bacterium]